MDFLNLLGAVTAPTGLWAKIINWLSSGIASYALVIIVLTLIVKVVLLPLDCVNKYTTKASTKKQALLKPELDKINKRYANNKNLLNQKTMELYKRNNYSVYGTCFTMLIYMVLTMVVFFTLFSSLNKMSSYKIYQEYLNVRDVYVQELSIDKNAQVLDSETSELRNKTEAEINQEIIDGINACSTEEKAQLNDTVVSEYKDIKQGFLWIKSIWRPDSSAGSVLSYKSFKSTTKITDADVTEDAYNAIMSPIESKYKSWNGYFILAIISALSTLGNFWIGNVITKARAKKKNKAYVNPGSSKAMMFIMPVIMGLFTLFYNAAFGLYIVAGNLFALVTTPLVTILVEYMDERKSRKEDNKNKISYSR